MKFSIMKNSKVGHGNLPNEILDQEKKHLKRGSLGRGRMRILENTVWIKITKI